MAYRCTNCNKGSIFGHNVSHAKNRTAKKFKPNLHVAKVSVGGTSRRVRLCTKCLRMYKSIQTPRVNIAKVETTTVAA